MANCDQIPLYPPGSNCLCISRSADGTLEANGRPLIESLTIPPASALTGGYNALTNVITIDNGSGPLVLNLSELDNEATKFAIQGTNLVLLAEDGTALSSLPLSGLDNQTLAITGSYAAGFTITIADGNTVTIPPLATPITANSITASPTCGLVTDVNGSISTLTVPLRPNATGVKSVWGCDASGALVREAVGTLITAPPVITFGVTDTPLGSTVTPIVNAVPGTPFLIPDNQVLSIGGTVTAPTVTISNGNTVALPPYPIVPPPVLQSHTNSWNRTTGLLENVDGIPSNIPIPAGTPTHILGYDLAGAPIYAPITKSVTITETTTVGGTRVVPQPVVTPGLFNDTHTINTLIVADAAGTVITLPDLNPSGNLYVGLEFDIKAFGTFIGPVTIQPPGGQLIDRQPNYTFNKPAGTPFPSRSVRWSGNIIGWILV